MSRIALIQSGDEIARHPYADTLEFMQFCCQGNPPGVRPLLRNLRPVTIELFSEDGMGRLLDGLDATRWSSVIFATNAFNSDYIRSTVERYDDTLSSYLESGGGIIIFHGGYFAPPFVREKFELAVKRRSSLDANERAVPAPRAANDVLLRFPDNVDLEQLVEYGDDGILPLPDRRSWGRLYWEVIEFGPGSTMIPVLQSADSRDLLLARSRDDSPERLVVCKIPADWQRNSSLTRNLISFALAGSPSVLTWPSSETANAAIVQNLATDHYVVEATEPELDQSPEQTWLFEHVSITLAPTEAVLDDMVESTVGAEFIRRGGTLLAATPDRPLHACRVVSVVGSRSSRILAEQLLNRLAAFPSWGEDGYPEQSMYRLRNTLSALHFLRRIFGEEIVPHLTEAKQARLVQRVVAWIGKRGEPLVTTLAGCEAFVLLGGSQQARSDMVQQLAAIETGSVDEDVRFLAQAVVAASSGTPTEDLFDAMLSWLEVNPQLTTAAVGRLCEAVAIIGRTREIARAQADLLAASIVQHLGDPPSDVGWVSSETTATILRALAIMQTPESRLPAEVARAMALATACLRAEHAKADAPEYAVGWHSRISEALIASERSLPTNINTLPSRTPPEIASRDVFSRLRSTNHSLQDELCAAREEREAAEHRIQALRSNLRFTIPAGWIALTLLVLAAFALPPWLFFSLSRVPLDVRLSVAGLLGTSWYALVLYLLKRYPLLPPRLERALGLANRGADGAQPS